MRWIPESAGFRVLPWFSLVVLATLWGSQPSDTDGTALPPLGSTASARTPWATDADLDGMPDELEGIFGTRPTYDDTDGDGVDDLLEWMLRSDPLDAASVAASAPSLRVYSYEIDGVLRVFFAVYPADFLDSLRVFVASPSFKLAPLGDGTIGIYDFTTSVLTGLKSITFTHQGGLDLVGVSFDLPLTVVDSYTSFSVGIAASVAGNTVFDEFTTFHTGLQRVTMYPQADPASIDPQLPPGFELQPLDPKGGAAGGGGGGGEDPQYCLASLGAGSPTGGGGISFPVMAANCVPDGLLFCIAADCGAMAGMTLTLIDYGFLKNSVP